MRLTHVYVRFYRAFNFDFLHKHDMRSVPKAWDILDDGSFFPYVEVEIDPELTCIVGANESGKSQLLSAIEHGLGKRAPGTADFCRYSPLFTVDEQLKTPHFGLKFTEVGTHEADALTAALGLEEGTDLASFRLFRTSEDEVTVYLEDGSSHSAASTTNLRELLPTSFRIDPDRAIPSSVPIAYLAGGVKDTAKALTGPARSTRFALLDPIVTNASSLLESLGVVESLTTMMAATFKGVEAPSGQSDRELEVHNRELELAYDLLVTVGGIHPSSFEGLASALRSDDEGLANGIIAAMNAQLGRSLNLSKWWTQDKYFRVSIAARDYDIVFTVQDRTGSEYSFAERSGGLKYFLSYLVQFLTHIAEREVAEILLMDEPDAFLSNQGQQDLLRIFREFTVARGELAGGQVIFVTHSPFLIDKNRADRIRVLDKGSGDEGARVVRDVGHNHYEPLRTALGGFVGETTFIGTCNLMLEGMVDQVYLAGMSTILASDGASLAESLDLNALTLVPAGGAQHVPYLVYLARGRDTDKPAVIALLDGDTEGDTAVKGLARGGARGKQVLPADLVIQLKPEDLPGVRSDRPGSRWEIEDLVPVEVGLEAVRSYLSELELDQPDPFPTTEDVQALLTEDLGVLEAIQTAIGAVDDSIRIDKLGFARHVIRVASQGGAGGSTSIRANFTALFLKLTSLQRKAERSRAMDSVAKRVERSKSAFLRDTEHKVASKADVLVLLEEIESRLDETADSDALLVDIRRLKEDLGLDRDLGDPIADMDNLRARLEHLKYADLLASQPQEPVGEVAPPPPVDPVESAPPKRKKREEDS